MQRRNREWQLKHPGLQIWILRFGLIQCMNECFGIGKTFSNYRVVCEMVEVPVRQPKASEVPASTGHLIQQGFDGVVRSVEQDGFPRRFVRDEETIGHRDTPGMAEDDHTVVRASQKSSAN